MWRSVAIGALLASALSFAFALEAEKRADEAEAKLEGLTHFAQLCDREVTTCLGWQARVALDLEALERMLGDGL